MDMATRAGYTKVDVQKACQLRLLLFIILSNQGFLIHPAYALRVVSPFAPKC